MKFLTLIATILCLYELKVRAEGQTNSTVATANVAEVNAAEVALSNRLDRLEVTTAVKLDSLEVRLAHSQTLLISFGAFASAVVTFLTIASHIRERRQHKDYHDERALYENRVKKMQEIHREDYERERKFYEDSVKIQTERDNQRHASEMTGVDRINEIMVVMKELFENRKELENRFEKALDDMEKKIEEAGKKVEDALKGQKETDTKFFDFAQKHREAARQVWMNLNNAANELAKTGRHDFKNKHAELVTLRNKFEEFQANHRINYQVEDVFLARIYYLCGIAAHYSNEPAAAEGFLHKVISFKNSMPSKKGEHGEQDQDAEPQGAYNARIAIANYFLGVIASNFGDFSRSIECLNEALKQEGRSNKCDLLTRLVLAEAYAGGNDNKHAEELLVGIEIESLNMQKKGTDIFASKRHYSRARLVRANLIIQQQQTDWGTQARELLQGIVTDDPAYYYATYTLAQTYALQSAEAKGAYSKAYDALRKPGELKTEGEVRSNILQHMVAAICAFHGPGDRQECERLLGYAAGLLGKLPKSNQQECTVFSPLTKANEPPGIIKEHIEQIRLGTYLAL